MKKQTFIQLAVIAIILLGCSKSELQDQQDSSKSSKSNLKAAWSSSYQWATWWRGTM